MVEAQHNVSEGLDRVIRIMWGGYGTMGEAQHKDQAAADAVQLYGIVGSMT